MFYRGFRSRCLAKLAWCALLILSLTGLVAPSNLAPMRDRVADQGGALKPTYLADLNRRLARFNENTGYSIGLLLIDEYNGDLKSAVSNFFRSQRWQSEGSAGTVLLALSLNKREVALATSENLNARFKNSLIESQIHETLRDFAKQPELTTEWVIYHVLVVIDSWFYRLDPPAGLRFAIRPPAPELVLFPAAPCLAFATALVIMAFTRAGRLGGTKRFFIAGLAGCLINIAATFLLRQPGGILPSILYYAAIVGFLLGGVIGACRPWWINETYEGRKRGEPGPLLFHWG